MSWEENEGGGGAQPFYIEGGGPTAPPVGCGYCRLAGGQQAPPGAKMRLNINFIYIEVPTARQEGGRGPAAPQLGGRGIKL